MYIISISKFVEIPADKLPVGPGKTPPTPHPPPPPHTHSHTPPAKASCEWGIFG